MSRVSVRYDAARNEWRLSRQSRSAAVEIVRILYYYYSLKERGVDGRTSRTFFLERALHNITEKIK